MPVAVDPSSDSLRTLLRSEQLPPDSRRTSTVPKDASRETTPLRTPNRTPATKRKDLLAISGIDIERRRSSASTAYRIEKNKVLLETSCGGVQELEILETKERHGVLRRALPVLPVPLAAACCVLNLVPGLGTLLSACLLLAGCGRAVELEGGGRARGAAYNLLVAVLQLVLAPVIVGWVWSIQRGALMLQEAVRRQLTLRERPDEPQVT